MKSREMMKSEMQVLLKTDVANRSNRNINYNCILVGLH